MRLHKDQISDTRVKLTITAEAEELTPIKKRVVGQMVGNIKVEGFRPGKAPQALAEKQLDQSLLQSEFLEAAISQLYSTAIRSEKLRVVSNPQADLKKFVPYTSLEFTAEVDVIGEIKLPDYKKIRMTKTPAKVENKDIDAVIKRLQTQLAEKKDIDRAAKDGDQVWIDFTGEDDKGKPVAGADGKDYPLLLGSDTFIPGFEENVVGLKAGDNKAFTIPFPKDYQMAFLQGKKVTFKVDVIKVQEVIEPKIDDEFAAKVGPFKTVTELKADVKKQLELDAATNAARDLENELVKQIASKSKVSLPKGLVDDQIIAIENEERQNITYRGQTWEEHLAEEKLTEEEHREKKRPAAEERVKISLVLSEISELEGIEITPEDLEIRMQLLKGQYKDPAMQSELDKAESRQNIANRLAAEKTIDKLVEYATKQ